MGLKGEVCAKRSCLRHGFDQPCVSGATEHQADRQVAGLRERADFRLGSRREGWQEVRHIWWWMFLFLVEVWQVWRNFVNLSGLGPLEKWQFVRTAEDVNDCFQVWWQAFESRHYIPAKCSINRTLFGGMPESFELTWGSFSMLVQWLCCYASYFQGLQWKFCQLLILKARAKVYILARVGPLFFGEV